MVLWRPIRPFRTINSLSNTNSLTLEAKHTVILSSAENEVTTQMPHLYHLSPLALTPSMTLYRIRGIQLAPWNCRAMGVLPIDVNLNKESTLFHFFTLKIVFLLSLSLLHAKCFAVFKRLHFIFILISWKQFGKVDKRIIIILISKLQMRIQNLTMAIWLVQDHVQYKSRSFSFLSWWR